MVHLFYSNQKAMFLALGITVFSLCSCNNQPKQQSQGITQEQLTSLLDSVKKTAKEEAKAELKEEVKAEIQSENDAQSSTSTTSTKFLHHHLISHRRKLHIKRDMMKGCYSIP